MTKRLRIVFAPASILGCVCLVLAFFTQLYGSGSEAPVVMNPRFKYWTNDLVWRFKKPYLWEVSLLAGPNDTGIIRQDDVNGKSCLGMHICQDGEMDQYLWATIHVRQNLGGRATAQLFAGTLEVLVYPTFLHERYPDSGNPKNVFGLEINDGTNIVWVIFSKQPSEVYNIKGHCIVIVDTPLNTWSYRRMQMAKYYLDAGWKLPSQVALILLIGATRDARGEYAGFVQEVKVT